MFMCRMRKRMASMENSKLEKVKERIDDAKNAIVRDIAHETLERIAHLEAERNILQEKIRVLKHDTTDMKEGRLDRIVTRHEISDEAHKTSVFQILKDGGSNTTNQWYVPYKVFFKGQETVINNSIAKINTGGSYKLSDGTIKYL